jgi:hypothetical protein
MPVISRLKSMRHRDRHRLCEWAELVGADLPDELACDDESTPREEFLATEQ